MKPQRLEIEGETFKDLREKFNYILNLALNRMHRMGINEGTVTAKVDIETEEADEGDGTAWRPSFKCEVAVRLPLKGKIAAGVPNGLKMVRDPKSDGFIIATEQYTFLDMLEEQKNEGSE
jgi:hypothetical protein